MKNKQKVKVGYLILAGIILAAFIASIIIIPQLLASGIK
jgi:hypothetical protein